MSLLTDAFKEFKANKAKEKVRIVDSKYGEEVYQKCKEILKNKKYSKPILLDSIPHMEKKKKVKLSKMLLMMHLLNQSKKG